MILKQNTAYTNRMFLMVQSADHITGITSGTPAVTISKAGGAFAAAANSPATFVGNGWCSITLNAADTSTLGDLAIHCSLAAADPTDFVDQVQSQVFTDLAMNVSGQVQIASNIKQNVALNGFSFVMTNSTTHAAQPGLTVTAQRSLGGAGFAPCANSVTEAPLTNGAYAINLAASDLNAPTVMLRFTATGADDLDILIVTEP